MRHFARFVVIALLPLSAGCALVDLREQTREFYSATVLVGQVTPPAGWRGPVVLAAVAPDSAIAHHVWLHEPGGYELIVPIGTYSIVAFGDANSNGALDRDEPAALRTSVSAAGDGMVTGLDLHLANGNTSALALLRPSRLTFRHSTQAGALANLDAPEFSADSGKRGYWSPLESFRQWGGNIYFVEPYEPGRVPVLFIHGAAGSAQDFRPFIDNLDRRYQAWVFQYPSGAPLDSMAHLLFWKLLNLQLRYGFERIHIVAHSMGGLVARRFLATHSAHFPQLGQFITLSTPWGGEKAAATGVEHSPAVVPSWRDMQPEGDFLRTLFQVPLPPTVEHTLLFGHRGGYNLLRPTTDGTVTLASQLRPEAQAGAKLVMGFDEDHASILGAPPVMQQVARTLEGRGDLETTGGRLQVELVYPHSAAVLSVSTPPFLVLHPASMPESTLTMPLPHRSGSAAIGPVPPGSYEVQLLAHGFTTTPVRQPLVVTAEGAPSLRLELTPQGVLANYIGVDGDSLAFPAGSFRPPHPSVVIEKVSLRGAGISRTVVPRSNDVAALWEAYLDGQDAAAGALFSFVNLPAGEYELEVRARGYQPYSGRYTVTPGVPLPASAIVLRK